MKANAVKSFVSKFAAAVIICGLALAYNYVNRAGIPVFKHLFFSGSRVIVVDAGHGGIDGGASSSSGTEEKDINLYIAQKLQGYIEAHGDTCIMIREVDKDLYSQSNYPGTKKQKDLRERRNIILKNKADMLLSIHLNHFPQSQYYGAQVFYLSKDEKSKILGEAIQSELISRIKNGNKREAKPSSTYYILKNNGVPSVIIECGFLSNAAEEQLLKSPQYQNRLAFSIYCGIMKYYDIISQGNTATP